MGLKRGCARSGYLLLPLCLMMMNGIEFCYGGITSSYLRDKILSLDMPLHSDVFTVPAGYNAPQQVHITQGDHEGKGVIISWITPDEVGSSAVLYWAEDSKVKKSANSTVVTYKYYDYSSGYIHHCTIENLEYDTKYIYEIGDASNARQFWFITPPKVGPDVPYTFGLIGDLGQTYDSNKTLTHYELNPAKGPTMLFVGDLSYADCYPNHDNTRWDTWGRFIERNAAYQPWIWTAGNHEIDFVPEIGEYEPFKPYKHRYFVPYRAANSTSPLWYSVKRASAYIIIMSSYSAYDVGTSIPIPQPSHGTAVHHLVSDFHGVKYQVGHLLRLNVSRKYTPQYKWLTNELQKVNRSETPWLIVLMHSPLYNSYAHHYMEGETMRVMYESWFVEYRVDVVFSGHVHAYERSERISNIRYNVINGKCTPVSDQSAPVYITIGDGGNQEGLVTEMTEPQPSYSAYREASFGHGTFEIKNKTHAYFSWHRNQDEYAVEADSLWFHNRYWKSSEQLVIASYR